MIEIMMPVCEFCFGMVVFVVAVFVTEFVNQMLKGMYRLEQYCEQYSNH